MSPAEDHQVAFGDARGGDLTKVCVFLVCRTRLFCPVIVLNVVHRRGFAL
jgi:hypothetical protein